MNDEKQWVVSEVYDAPRRSTIKKWSPDDRPREKMLRKGAAALSDAELLAILLGSGNSEESAVDLSKRILSDRNNSLTELGKARLETLMSYKGIGEAKAITILAANELAHRRQMETGKQRMKIDNAESIYDYMKPLLQDLPQEEAWILLFNNALRLIADPIQISRGGLTETSVDVRLICRHALLSSATGVVLCHNHPSGSPRPSRNDDSITSQVSEALRMMRLHLIDHVVVAEDGFYSYRDNGKL